MSEKTRNRVSSPILIVEDNAHDLEAAKRAFHKTGIPNYISHAWTAEEAIDYLLNPENSAPCLIMLDLNLPGMGGRKALELIRRDKSMTQIPIIVLTTSDYDKDVEMCYALGASSYIKKPMDFQALCTAIGNLVEYWLGTSLLPPLRGERDRIEALENAKREAENANQAKTDFLATMSHELRTPLNSILGMLRLILTDDTLAHPHKEMLDVVQKAANGLLTTVNDILVISKIEAGCLDLENIPFDFELVLNDTIEGLRPLCSEKGLSLSCSIAGDAIPHLLGDPLHLSRILTNLVGNAIKYTEKGSIAVDADAKRQENNTVAITVSVTDTGIGIPQEKLESIFEKYTQGDTSITRRFGGTGLGLNISQKITQKMGGNIGVESLYGKGSRFWFSIPFTITDAPLRQEKETSILESDERLPAAQRKNAGVLKILVAEDDLLNIAFLKKLLPRMGFVQYDIATTGQEALQFYNDSNYDLVLMDCHMPILSGYDATREIRDRERERGKAAIPIIAMTADAIEETRSLCLKAGMDEYVTKPLNIDNLRKVLSYWVTFPDE